MYERLLAFLGHITYSKMHYAIIGYIYITNVHDSNKAKLLKSLGLMRKRKLII